MNSNYFQTNLRQRSLIRPTLSNTGQLNNKHQCEDSLVDNSKYISYQDRSIFLEYNYQGEYLNLSKTFDGNLLVLNIFQ